MYINQLLSGLDINNTYPDRDIKNIIYDTRSLKTAGETGSSVFVCIPGFVFDGHDYAMTAYDSGIRCFMAEKPLNLPGDAEIIYYASTRKALAVMSANYFENPAKKLLTIAITGTKGKTNTSFMLKNILEKSGKKVGLIGTTGVFYGGMAFHAENSTPESYILQKYFKDMLDSGCDTVVMEASSQGFKLFRTHGIIFDIGVFTNLSPDHINDNEHNDFDEYTECKKMLFNQCRHGVFNMDDEHFPDMIKGCTCDITTFGFNEKAMIRAGSPVYSSGGSGLGTSYEITYNDIKTVISMPLLGIVSIYNSMCAATVCSLLNIDIEYIKDGLSVTTVKGRAEIIPLDTNFSVIIDYAHNELSVESIYKTLIPYKKNRFITVFGCGGNRARQRRFAMGDIITRNSEIVIITSDNPRNEELDDIIKDIQSGIKSPIGKIDIIKDRKSAIYRALDLAKKDDIVLILGKGHQEYEEVCGVKYPFNERTIVSDYLK